jgi:hypothetical protein
MSNQKGFTMMIRRMFLILAAALSMRPVFSGVVINEVFYHAPDDLSDLQWIELLNHSDQAADLSGWRLGKTIRFSFPKGTTIGPHGFLVLCKDRNQFQQFYSVAVAGEFESSFRKGEGHLELRDAANHLVDSVDFTDRAPWPRSAAGHTASLERICPGAPGVLPENWAGSPLSEDEKKPGGSPGAQNGAFCATLPPLVTDVTFQPPRAEPDQPIEVQARVSRRVPLSEVSVLYQVVGTGSQSEERAVPMKASGSEGHYSATIPGQKAGQIVRLRIQAKDSNSALRFFPSPTDLRPALSCLVFTNIPTSQIPFGLIIHTEAAEVANSKQQRQNDGAPFNPEGQVRFMVQMQLDRLLDLPGLWTALTLTNTVSSGEGEKLRTLFARKMIERNQLQEKALAASKDPEAISRQLPGLVQTYKTSFGEELKPLLSADQIKLFEDWRKARPGGEGPMGRDPATMLRQFIRLEPAYAHLTLNTNIDAAKWVALRLPFQAAMQEREALLPQLRKLMGGPRDQDSREGEDLEGRAMAIEPRLDRKLTTLLTSAQAREFAGWRQADAPPFMGKGGPKPADSVVGRSAFVYVDPKNGEPKLYDFVHAPNRSGGWKIHFGKDAPLNGMTGIDLIFEASERWVLAEPLAYELHRRAGLAAPLTDFVRLWVDGDAQGYYLLIEQPNKAFLRRNGLHDDGNLYKANWAGRGLAGQNEKRTNLHSTHDDLIQLVEQLESSKANPAEQWEIIKRQLVVEEVINHYAVRMLISDWDGFHNNYYLYHDLRGTGQWTFYPWDEDKTWGEYDNWQNRPLYDMPLSFGSEEDRPPGAKPGAPAPRGFNAGSWWRPGGYVSKPVLANPYFRKLFLARIKELLDSEFKEDRLFPYIDTMKQRLAAEVPARAEALHQDPAQAQQRFASDFDSLKEFIKKRRQWLLDQDAIRNAGAFDRTQLPAAASVDKGAKRKKAQ